MQSSSGLKKLRKRDSGQSTMELVAGIMVLVPVILFLIDVAILTIASFRNDAICREVCRAAAAADPKNAQLIAQSEIKKYNHGDFASFSLNGAPVVEHVPPSSGHGLVMGSVTVKTTAHVSAPFLIGFFTPDVVFQAEQSFPYTYTMP